MEEFSLDVSSFGISSRLCPVFGLMVSAILKIDAMLKSMLYRLAALKRWKVKRARQLQAKGGIIKKKWSQKSGTLLDPNVSQPFLGKIDAKFSSRNEIFLPTVQIGRSILEQVVHDTGVLGPALPCASCGARRIIHKPVSFCCSGGKIVLSYKQIVLILLLIHWVQLYFIHWVQVLLGRATADVKVDVDL